MSSELLPVAHKWRNIGLALKLDPNLLERIGTRNHRDVISYMSDTLTEWLQKAYDTTRFGDPSWKLLTEAVAHPVGGNNPALAKEISLKYNGKNSTLFSWIPPLCVFSLTYVGQGGGRIMVYL